MVNFMKLKVYNAVFFVSFILLVIVRIATMKSSPIGKVIANGTLTHDLSGVEMLVFLVIVFVGTFMLVTINRANPHLDVELRSFNVEKVTDKKFLRAYLSFCREKHRNFKDIKGLLMDKGWPEKMIREIGDTLNR